MIAWEASKGIVQHGVVRKHLDIFRGNDETFDEDDIVVESDEQNTEWCVGVERNLDPDWSGGCAKNISTLIGQAGNTVPATVVGKNIGKVMIH